MRAPLKWTSSATRLGVLLFAAATTLAVIGQSWWAVAQDRALTVEGELRNGLVAVRLLEQHTAREIEVAEQRLDSIAAAVFAMPYGQAVAGPAIQILIDDNLKTSRSAGAFQYVNLQGRRWVSIVDFPPYVFEHEERAYIAHLLSHPNDTRLLLGVPLRREIDSELVLPIARNLYDHSGQLVGLISTDVSMAGVADTFAAVAGHADVSLSLVEDAGPLILRAPSGAADLDTAPLALARALAGAGLEGQLAPGLAGPYPGERMAVFRKTPRYAISTVYSRDLQTLLAPWRQRSIDRLLATAGFVAFQLTLSYLLLLQIDRLNRAQRHQRSVEQEVRDLNRALEQRVLQRTEKLQEALASVQRFQGELVRAEKMAALGSLVAGIAHELNTPIGNSLTVASTLQDVINTLDAELVQARPRRSVLSGQVGSLKQGGLILMRNLARAADLIASFKQVAVDQSANHRRPFGLKALIEDIALTLTPMFKGAGHHLELELDPAIEMDSYPGALSQILSNFIENAVVHGFGQRREGTMRIVATHTAAGLVHLRFSDDGRGIEAHDLRRVFDPFFTTRMGQGGSGLGMSVVYNLVTSVLGGTIEISSTPGGGTVLDVIMPASAMCDAAELVTPAL